MPTARLAELDVCYEVRGEGHRLLFAGGTGGDLRQTPTVFDSALGRHFEVLAYDQRGMGRTSKPEGPYTMAGYADDAAALLDHVGWPDASVMGVSFGGMVAQELALRHQGRVRRLVLACTSSGGGGGASFPLHQLEGLDADARARRSLALADTRCDAGWQAAHPEEAAAVLAMVAERAAVGAGEPGGEQGARRQLDARRDHDTWDRLGGLDLPVLVCGGRHDGIAPPANQEALAARIPDARLELFDGGHYFLLQDRAAYARIVEFLLEDTG